MPEEEIERAIDPYQRQFIVSAINRFVVSRLGGFKNALRTEKLVRNDLNSIWDDRVLNRAFHVFGGIPDINIINTENTVPQVTSDILAEMVARSG